MQLFKPQLSVTLSGKNVTIQVSYEVEFSPFERFLSVNGMQFKEFISIIGSDDGEVRTPAGMHSITGDILNTFPQEYLQLTAGQEPVKLSRQRFIVVPRSSLKEDIDNDNDEVKCRVSIIPSEFPKQISMDTEVQALAFVKF